jgi:hypothetical protein
MPSHVGLASVAESVKHVLCCRTSQGLQCSHAV